MKEKLEKAYYLACDLLPKLIDGKIEDIDEMISSLIDGLYQDRIVRLMNGRCSLQEYISFDITKEEEYLDSVIERMELLL